MKAFFKTSGFLALILLVASTSHANPIGKDQIDENYQCDSYRMKTIQQRDQLEIAKFATEYRKIYTLRESARIELERLVKKYRFTTSRELANAYIDKQIDFGQDRILIQKTMIDLQYSQGRLEGLSKCAEAMVQNLKN